MRGLFTLFTLLTNLFFLYLFYLFVLTLVIILAMLIANDNNGALNEEAIRLAEISIRNICT